MTLLDRLRLVRDRYAGKPEWVRRMMEGKLPAKDYTFAGLHR